MVGVDDIQTSNMHHNYEYNPHNHTHEMKAMLVLWQFNFHENLLFLTCLFSYYTNFEVEMLDLSY